MKTANQTALARTGVGGCVSLLIFGLSGGCPSSGGGTTLLTCMPLSGTINTDTTLSASCYDVSNDVTVEGDATLTILPGVTLNFQADTVLQISSDGTLSAAGTADSPIVLTGQQKFRGFWNGVYFRDSQSFGNRMDFVTVEYGGGRNLALGAQGNVVLQEFGTNPVRANISNCTLRESSSYGFYFGAGSVVDDFDNNTVTANTMGAGFAFANVAEILDDTGSYTGNDVDVVVVEGNTVDTDQTWEAIDADYLMGDRTFVDALLTIAAGARLVFRQDATMEISDTGALSAVGTAVDPIVFTGEQMIPGFWGGIFFRDSNSFANQLDFVTVEYGGSRNFALGAQGNIALEEFGTNLDVRINITNSTIQHSSTFGVWAGTEAIVNSDIETVNTFNNNASGDFFRDP